MKNQSVKSRSMREAFGDALVELGKENERLVVLDADVSSSTLASRVPLAQSGATKLTTTRAAASVESTGRTSSRLWFQSTV